MNHLKFLERLQYKSLIYNFTTVPATRAELFYVEGSGLTGGWTGQRSVGRDEAKFFRNSNSASKTGSAFLDCLDFSELQAHATYCNYG